MQVSLTITHDLVSARLAKQLKNAVDRKGIHQAMGMAIVSITKRAFNDPGLRAAPWPNKTNGSPATLRLTGTLAKSIRVTGASDTGVTVGSDRKYAAIHQLGGKTAAHVIRPKKGKALKTPFGLFGKVNHPGSKIPRRPFFPFHANGQPTAKATAALVQVIQTKLNK